MDWLIFAGVVVAFIALGALAQKMGWIDLSNKQRSSGSAGALGIGDEVFHPTRHEAQIELDRQTSLPAPAPIPGDGDQSIEGNRIRIDIKGAGRHRGDGEAV